MKKVFSVFFSMLFLLVTSQQALIIVHFKLNQQAIERDFCINKNQPELECHGKCHLKKELQQTEKSDFELTSIGKKIDMILVTDTDFKIEIPKSIDCNKIQVYKAFNYLEPDSKIVVPPPILLTC